ncbi:MAG TPA: L,D-transpeptidase family protein [Chthoniobacteraceae bacterium]|nr:L,D-transpeptidase family protein [Chthoniobacteraceae bacterium]
MNLNRIPLVLSLAVFALLALAPDASAQLFKPRKVKRPGAYISKQPPAKIDRGLESQINPENSTVVVSLSQQRAFLKIRGTDSVYIDTPISSGKRAGSTPTGNFTVLEKDADHRSSIYGDFVDRRGRVVRSGVSLKVDSAPAGTRYLGAPMKFFCRITWSGVGMHVGILPGYPASHGCIRLPSDIAPLIYQKVKIGTPVTVIQ